MPVSKAQQKAVNKYMSEKYDRINLVVPKGRRDELRAKAEAAGKSLNSYLIGLIEGETQQYITPEAMNAAIEAAKEAGGTYPGVDHESDKRHGQQRRTTQADIQKIGG